MSKSRRALGRVFPRSAARRVALGYGKPAVLVAVVLCLWAAGAAAQELTPRAYWPAPKGVKLLVAGYSYSSGDVLFDPSIPLYGVDSRINAGVLAYVQTLSLWGRTANFLVEQPYSWGTTQGLLGDIPASRDFSGTGDLGVTLSVNLLGAPSMTPRDFQAFRGQPRPILGASVKVLAPTGHYDSDRLINVGANRWALKAELGYIIPLRPKWLLELDAGAWFFAEDEDFIAGRKQQEPIVALQAHVVKRIRPGFWASLDLNYYFGGRQTIGGSRLTDIQRNSKVGGTVVVPFRGRRAFKVGYAVGVLTEYGTDFNQLIVAHQVLFR